MIVFLTSRLGGWAVGGLGMLLILVWAMSLRADVAKLEGREELHLRNISTLNTAITAYETSAETTSKQTDANLKRITKYETDQKITAAETQEMLGEINELRATEERAALMDPYKRGLVAGDRLNRIMQRFSTNTGLPSSDNANGDKADDPSGAKPKSSEGTGSDSNNP